MSIVRFFWGCSIDNGVFSIFNELGEIAVDDNNPYYRSVNGILYDKQATNLICCPCAYKGKIAFGGAISEITSHAFSHCRFIDKLTIPDSVKIIGSYAFAFSSVTDMTLPDGLLSINERTFFLCERLKSVSIPNSVRTIEREAISRCRNLSEINLPYSLEKIDDYAFLICTGIKKLNIPANVKHISKCAFKDMVDLAEITVSEKNEYFGMKDGVLFNSESAEQIFVLDTKAYTVSADGMFKMNSDAIVRYLGNENDVIIPPYVRKICSRAFLGKDMRKVFVPDTVREIESNAFLWCGNLEEVHLPDEIDFFDESAFALCGSIKELVLPEGTERFRFTRQSKLERLYLPSTFSQEIDGFQLARERRDSRPIRVIVSPENKYYRADNDFLFNRDKTLLIAYMGNGENITVPEGVEIIGQNAFGTSGIRQIALPDSVRIIEMYAFSECEKLEETNIKSAEEIGMSAFSGCRALKKITLPQNLKKIQDYAFSNCSSLKDVIIPDGTESIGDEAFMGCTHLNSVYIPDSVQDIHETAFQGCEDVVLILSEPSCAEDNKDGIKCITE